MFKLKQSLIAFAGMSLIIGLVTLATPSPTQGQGNSDNAPLAKDVNVVNTPTVNAQQSGAWNVGITGTPTVKLDPTANHVTVTPRGAKLVFDSGLVSYPEGTDTTLIGPIDISGYSKIRVGVSHRGPSDINVFPRTTLVTAPPIFLENSFPLDSFSVEDNVGSVARNGPSVSRVYEVAGTTLFILVQFGDGEHDVRAAVFGS